MAVDYISISEHPLDLKALLQRIGRPGAGAVVLFVGTVRDHAGPRTGVTHLEYEAFTGEVERSVRAIIDAIRAQIVVEAVAVEHRVGTVAVGEPSVAVAVSAEHRVEAFSAAAAIIDQLKASAPIWKKEHWKGGAEWVRGS